MAPVGESSSSQVEETESAQHRHASEADVEISRKGNQMQIERQAKSFKQRFTTDLNTAKKLMKDYETDYPTDSSQFDSSCARQLEDAEDIVTVYKRLTDRWKNVESLQKDIKVCILSSVTLQEKEVDETIKKLKHHWKNMQIDTQSLKRIKE